jgi:hypothetical protein
MPEAVDLTMPEAVDLTMPEAVDLTMPELYCHCHCRPLRHRIPEVKQHRKLRRYLVSMLIVAFL